MVMHIFALFGVLCIAGGISLIIGTLIGGLQDG